MTREAWNELLEMARLPDERIELGRAAFLLSASENAGLDMRRQLAGVT